MNEAKASLWQAIELLAACIPFSKEKVEAALPTRIVDTEAPGGDVFQFLEGSPVPLSDGARIARLDLRIRREAGHPGFLVLELEGRCVSLDEVREHYPTLRLVGLPRGRSLDESTTHAATTAWGQLSFGFKERHPACLASVAFDPA